MKQTLLSEAMKIQTKIDKATSVYETSRLKAIQDKQDQRNRFKAAVLNVREALSEFEGVPLKYYEWRGQSQSSWNVSPVDYYTFKLDVEKYGYSDISELKGGGFGTTFKCLTAAVFRVEVQDVIETGKFAYFLKRDVFSKDEIARYLDIKPNYSWQSKGTELIDKSFDSLEDLKQCIKEFVVKIIDVDRYKELLNQTELKTILATHLNASVDDIEVKHVSGHTPVFKSGEKSYVVLKPTDLAVYFAKHVAKNPSGFFDSELLGENSRINAMDWHRLKAALTAPIFGHVMEKLVSLEAYGKKYAERYGFEKFVVPYKNCFVVDLAKLESGAQ